jgi:hypothetical protein
VGGAGVLQRRGCGAATAHAGHERAGRGRDRDQLGVLGGGHRGSERRRVLRRRGDAGDVRAARPLV